MAVIVRCYVVSIPISSPLDRRFHHSADHFHLSQVQHLDCYFWFHP